MGDNPERMETVWHSGFYGAMELELSSDKGFLEFQKEYVLNKEPLLIDMLINGRKRVLSDGTVRESMHDLPAGYDSWESEGKIVGIDERRLLFD